jgi:hypothetical protein
MRLLLTGALAALTAAGLAAIRPAVLTDGEQAAAATIRENRMRADVRFLSSDHLAGPGPAMRGDPLVREYLETRFEAIGLEPGAPGGGWEQEVDLVGVNVVARLPGQDPLLSAEAVVYRTRRERSLDGASGLATMLAVAEAFVALPERPRRTILFAAVAAEGPSFWGRLAASIDIDGTSVAGRAREVRVIGLGQSSLDEWVRVLAETQGRAVVEEDHPGFARAGVPSLTFHASAAEGQTPDLSGGVEDARLLFLLGAKVANAPLAPSRRAGGGLGAARRNALAGLGR